jgi:hypothetical protein
MRRLIDAARHAADHDPAIRDTGRCNHSGNRKPMGARLTCSHDADRRLTEHGGIAL